MDELSTLNNDEQAFRSFLSKAVEEEMIHNMDLLALRQEHKRQSELWSNIKELCGMG